MPVIIMIPTIGLKCGIMINAARDATAMAHITARVTISLACGFRFSKLKKNGTMEQTIISTLVR